MHTRFLSLAFILLLFATNSFAIQLNTTPSMLVIQGGIGMQIDVEDVQKDVPFNAFFDWIGNKEYSSESRFQGSLALALISANGEIKQLIHEERDLTINPGFGYGQYQKFYNVTVNVDIDGSDIIRFITLERGDDIWCPVTSKEGKQDYCKVKGNTVVKSKINVNILGHNDIPYEGTCLYTYGSSIQNEPIYSSEYNLKIFWPEGKTHHFVNVNPTLDRVQIDPERILFQCIEEPEYTVTLMACSDDELITEQQHFTVKTPGTLGELVKANEKYQYVNNISVSGELNEADFTFMREEMLMLEHVDLSGANIKELPSGAFKRKAIKSIILPKCLERFGSGALKGTDLSQLDIPASVNEYGLNALNSTKNLTAVVLRNPEVIPISWCVLNGSNRSSGVLFVPKGTKNNFAADNEWGQFSLIVEGDRIEDYIAANDGVYQYSGVHPELTITKVVKPKSTMDIPETVVFQDKTFRVTGIGERVFYGIGIEEIHIPKTVTTIALNAILGACWDLTKIMVAEENPIFFSHEGVLYDRTTSTLIKYPQAKDETEFSIPEGIENIGDFACTNNIIQKIILPSTLKQIGGASLSAVKLKYIISKASNPPIVGLQAFPKSAYTDAILYVPSESIEAYKNDPAWSCFFNIYEISEDAGTNAIEADDNPITVNGNMITVSSKEDIEIFSLDGKRVYKGNSSPIYVPNGLYIIKANGKSIKIKI